MKINYKYEVDIDGNRCWLVLETFNPYFKEDLRNLLDILGWKSGFRKRNFVEISKETFLKVWDDEEGERILFDSLKALGYTFKFKKRGKWRSLSV